MKNFNPKLAIPSQHIKAISVFERIPTEVIKWAESIPLKERRYVLSLLSHLMSAAPTETESEILDDYAADDIVSIILKEQVPLQLVENYLKKFHIDKELNDFVLQIYIKQFYIHSAQDLRTKPGLYLDSVLRLVSDLQERNKLFYYILGFEIIKMMFQMSWLQHERLYQLQKHQEDFLRTYIKPIQYAHRINRIIVPKYEKVFFAKRDFFIKRPQIKKHKLIKLVMNTFTVNTVINLGFLMIHHLDFLVFDYEYIFNSEPEGIFK